MLLNVMGAEYTATVIHQKKNRNAEAAADM
jgi:hypothetical protein